MSDAPKWNDMSDWSDLPDVYVTKAECSQGMFWRIEACSVPMAIGPEVRLVRADLAAERERKLVEALRALMVVFDHCDITDGVCCCGENMETHSNPRDCGHIPVDHGAYNAGLAHEKTRATLKELGYE